MRGHNEYTAVSPVRLLISIPLYPAGQQQSVGVGGGRLQSGAPFHSMSDLTAPRGPGAPAVSPAVSPAAGPPRAAGTGGWILVSEDRLSGGSGLNRRDEDN